MRIGLCFLVCIDLLGFLMPRIAFRSIDSEIVLVYSRLRLSQPCWIWS